MTKSKMIPLAAGFAVALVAVLYFSRERPAEIPERTEPLKIAANESDGGSDLELPEPEPVPPVESDLRIPEILKNSEPPANPLVRVVSREKILTGPEPFMAPQISADGKHLIVTGNSYRGLWVANPDGTGLRKVSDGNLAGWRPVTTEQGELIYRTGTFDEQGNLTFAIHLYDLETGVGEVVYEGTNEDIYPAWLTKEEDYILMLRDGEIVPHRLREIEDVAPLNERDQGIAYADGGQVWYRHLGMEDAIGISSDIEATGLESMSPAGDRVAYFSGNKNSVFIVDLATGTEVGVGEGSNLSWSPNGELLLYEVTSDDGHEVLDSQIFVVPAEGGEPQRVTFDPGYSFYNPAWSPDGRYIVATDLHTGEVHRLDIETSESRTQ